MQPAQNPISNSDQDPTGVSPASRSLRVLGDRWTLLILCEALGGVTRFEGFRERLGIARNILSGRLRGLVNEDILERKLYQSHPDRYEYRLTRKGSDLYELILALRRWGERWLPGGGQPGVLIHEKCGQETVPTVTCSHCKQELSPEDLRDVVPKVGPPKLEDTPDSLPDAAAAS